MLSVFIFLTEGKDLSSKIRFLSLSTVDVGAI